MKVQNREKAREMSVVAKKYEEVIKNLELCCAPEEEIEEARRKLNWMKALIHKWMTPAN